MEEAYNKAKEETRNRDPCEKESVAWKTLWGNMQEGAWRVLERSLYP